VSRSGPDRPQHNPIKNDVPHWFRFGASSLANDILMQLQKEADGHYQSGDYFSID
jgi:hypothetical protein